jgi:hypothetical protein
MDNTAVWLEFVIRLLELLLSGNGGFGGGMG